MDQGFSLNTLKKLAAEPDYTDVSLTAAERVRALGKMGANVEINEDIAPRRYFRSGVEMERMAAVYLEEGSLENAYVLYTKFITLFVEKLPSHRDYQQSSVPDKQLIMKKLQEVAFPRRDELKKRLEEKYSREHTEYLRAQTQAVVVDGCGQKLQGLSLLDEDRRRGLLLEGERQRVAALRRMQIESEQFRYFEDQLRRQELASRRGEEAEHKVETKVPQTHNELVLTHVVIPKQSAGPDFCDMENTHPTQTAFLSSVDLHTHCSYQLMLPEAVAIVCAPKHNELTGSGMSEVSGCRMKGFHPHSKEPPLFTVCKHVVAPKTLIQDHPHPPPHPNAC
ncbi:hypothetical protein INR49_008077, partial [Caranx melampygus]